MNEDSGTLRWLLVSACATSIFSSGQTRAQDSTEDESTDQSIADFASQDEQRMLALNVIVSSRESSQKP